MPISPSIFLIAFPFSSCILERIRLLINTHVVISRPFGFSVLLTDVSEEPPPPYICS